MENYRISDTDTDTLFPNQCPMPGGHLRIIKIPPHPPLAKGGWGGIGGGLGGYFLIIGYGLDLWRR